MIIKALSLVQPWAILVVIGAKKYETRSWNTTYRGRILIHASLKKDPSAMNLCIEEPFYKYIGGLRGFYDLPYGAIIGECTIVSTHDTEDAYMQFHCGNQEDKDELKFGDYSPGRKCWKLIDPVKYDVPIPCKGSLSLWNYDDVLKQPVKNKPCW